MIGQVKTIDNVKQIVPFTADVGSGNPIGTILPLYKKVTPNGYLYCDGSTFDETVYPGLYAYLGTNVLPDYRECAIVGAEQNTTDTIADHDVYTEGQFKDDQLQDHMHMQNYTGASITSGGANLWYYSDGNGLGIKTGRSGTVTRGKRKAVYFYIKATTGLDENQQDYVLDAINENNSYSTTEHTTGKKWIDGKPIYRCSFICSTTFTGTANIWNDITTNFTNLSGLIANISSLVSANLHNCYPNDNSPLQQLISGEYLLNYPSTNNISVYLFAGQTIRKGAVLVVEYTKTTD